MISAASVAEMQRDQTFGVPIVYSPHPDGRRYGLGEWRDIVDAQGNAVQLSSQGLYGFSPWIDTHRGYYGVFLVYNQLSNVYVTVAQLQATVRSIFDASSASVGGIAEQPDAIAEPSRRNNPAYLLGVAAAAIVGAAGAAALGLRRRIA